MTLHCGIATSESFFIGYAAILLDILHWEAHLSCSRVVFLDDHYAEAYFSQSMMDFLVMAIPWRRSDIFFSHWSMRHDLYISSGVPYTRAYPSHL